MMKTSSVRQNFAKECEDAINKQINVELQAAYDYMAFFTYFDRDDVSFPKAAEFFRKASHEEREHAEKLAKYQNKRGGRIEFMDLRASLLELHNVAEEHNDPGLCEFIESECLETKEQFIKIIADYLTQVQRVGKQLGEYLFDQLTLKE
ncbi:ferritin heavy chain [Schistosoma bovis]|uniref:Ferritin n=1 Tax=Schistosoma bovis TaxID=6184 RepID=A0A430Q9X5_SCHBO|nr:ferritin heavy chain [Schistosoma bovis]